MLRQRHAFWTRVLGICAIIVIVAAALGFGAWLIQMRETAWGVALILGSVATLVGTAIYGHKARSMPSREPQEGAPQLAQK
jgi:hypothetical protein